MDAKTFSKATVRGHHPVERSNTITRLESDHVKANSVDDASDVVAPVCGTTHPCVSPTFGVGARNDHFDRDFINPMQWDGRGDNLDLGPFGDNCLLHHARGVT